MPHLPQALVTCVLNWNRPDDTIACLTSLLAGEALDQHLLVVDNGSSDDSVARLQDRFGGDIEILETGTNLYFAGGMNAGIERAMALGAEMILILNNDTLVEPGAVTTLLDAAAHHPDAGIVAPAVYYAADRSRIWSLGARESRWWPFPCEVGHDGKDAGQYLEPLWVDFVTGCAMLIRRQVIADIGPFDARYPMYYEDADFCVRARRAGYGLLVEPRARVYHAVAQSAGIEAARVRYLRTRGRVRFYRSYRFGHAPLLTHVTLCCQESARALCQAARGHRPEALAHWHGLVDGYGEPIRCGLSSARPLAPAR